MKNYEQIIKANPVYFENIDNADKLRMVFGEQINTMMEERDEDGRRVYVYRPGVWNPDKVKFTDIFAAAFVMADMISEEPRTQIAGVTAVADTSGFGFKQARNFGVNDARIMSSFLLVRIK